MDSHIDTSRSKLNKILQDLADKAEESATEEEDGLKVSPGGNDSMPPPTTPSKKGGRAPRKRRKKEANVEEVMDNSKPSYILKLFDRSVDMAQFRRDSSMYVMCRAWTQNKPRAAYELGNTDGETADFQEPGEAEDPQLVFSLSGPVKQEQEDKPKVATVNKTIRVERDIDIFPEMNLLKSDNIARWRKVRNSWRDSSLKEQRRYSASLMQLKSLFTQP